MKKTFTLLFASLLAFVGAVKAQPTIETSTADAPKYYVIASYNRGGVLTNAGVGTGLTHVALSDAGYWYFEKANEEGGVYIVNKEKSEEGGNVYVGSDRTASTTAAVWYILPNGVNNVGLSISETAPISSESCIDANNYDTGVGSWAPSATDWQGTTWVVSEEKNLVDVVYNYTYGDTDKGSETIKVATAIGYEFPAVTSFPFGITATKPTGDITESDVVEGVVTKTIILEDNLPFECAESYEEAETNGSWYYLVFHAESRNYLYYDANLSYLDASKTAVDEANEDAYTWAFVGNPFDGFKLVNRAAGADMLLSSAAEPTADKEYPVMTATADVTGNQTWDLSSSPHGTNGFYMAYDGTNKRLNKQDGKVCYWLGGADAGSTFMVELRLTEAEKLQALIDVVEEYAVGATVGYIKSLDPLTAPLADAKDAVESKTGCKEAAEALQAAVAALETVQPDPTKFYTIVSAMPTTDARGGQMMYINADSCMQFRPEYNDSAVFQFVDAGEGKFYLYNATSKTYLSTAKAHGYGQAEMRAKTVEDAKPVVITNMGRSNVVKIVPEGGAMLHAQWDYSLIVGWDNDDHMNASAWVIEETSAPTGIEQLTAPTSTVIYDLTGRRVEKMQKGIYIVNGKKVLVK